MVTLKQLTAFANRKGRQITNVPFKVELGNLPQHSKKQRYDVLARGYVDTFTPADKTQKPHPVRYGVVLDRQYYRQNQKNPNELRQAVIHEMCHDHTRTRRHTKPFVSCCKKLGADKKHQTGYWD
jgi:hypothetical protein